MVDSCPIDAGAAGCIASGSSAAGLAVADSVPELDYGFLLAATGHTAILVASRDSQNTHMDLLVRL